MLAPAPPLFPHAKVPLSATAALLPDAHASTRSVPTPPPVGVALLPPDRPLCILPAPIGSYRVRFPTLRVRQPAPLPLAAAQPLLPGAETRRDADGVSRRFPRAPSACPGYTA